MFNNKDNNDRYLQWLAIRMLVASLKYYQQIQFNKLKSTVPCCYSQHKIYKHRGQLQQFYQYIKMIVQYFIYPLKYTFYTQCNKLMLKQAKQNKQDKLNKQTQKRNNSEKKTIKKQSCPYHRQNNKKIDHETPTKHSRSQKKYDKTNQKLSIINEEKNEKCGSSIIIKQKQFINTAKKAKPYSAKYGNYSNPKSTKKSSSKLQGQPIKLIPELVREQQKHAKLTISNEIEDERLEMLKIYIKQDSQRIQRLKRIRDEHVINEINCTQNSLKMKAARASPIAGQINPFHNQLVQLQQKHQEMRRSHDKEINNLKNDLQNQRFLKQELHKKSLDLQKAINAMKSQNQKKDKIGQTILSNQNMRKADKNNLPQKQISIQRKRYSQDYIKSMESTINQLSKTRELLEKKLNQCQAQKQIIKRNAKEVLAIVQKQISRSQDQKSNL